jgi:hypothetical protein
MTLHRFLLAVVAGFGLLQAGCLASAEDVDIDGIDDVGMETLDLWGGGGNNGLDPYAFGVSLPDLRSSTSAAFNGNNAALVTMATNKPGHLTLEYAAACALPTGSYTIAGNSFSGGGILASTAGWPNGALAAQHKYDLFECMMAHLNPYGAIVPIRLTGEAVAPTLGGVQGSLYSFQEAVWVAYEDVTGDLQLAVWPLPELQTKCHAITSQAAKKRACGSLAGRGTCDIEVRNDLATACSHDANTGYWTCDGHRAIQTWLKADGWLTLYPDCAPIPQ